MAELLVLLACLKNSGCNEASTAYYVYKPEVRQQLDVLERKARYIIGDGLATYAAPILVYGAGGTASFRVVGHINFQVSSTSKNLIFERNF